jgi:MFS family permease
MEVPVSEETRTQDQPATFNEVFGQSEFRAVYLASTLSWLGDYVAKAAVTVLVYQQTDSVALSAAAFAVSYLPWLVGGPLLAALAERYPYRSVMVVADLTRMVLVALVAVPHLPVPVMLVLLFATTLANPPSKAARSALTAQLLSGDKLVVGLSLLASTGQAAQVCGYVAGAAIAARHPGLALLANAATFGLSALIVGLGVRRRPSPAFAGERHLLRETAEGVRVVFGTPVLRAIAVLVFASMLFAIVPEGLAAAWAGEQQPDEARRGVVQALIMAASPVGFMLGSLLVGRFVRPDLRRSLILPMAVVAPLTLVPTVLDPPPVAVAVLCAGCGFVVAGLLPVANGLFVQALPSPFRARAFGVMATGTQVAQGSAVLVTGLLADRFGIPVVVGLWSVAGVLLMLTTAARWPDAHRFADAVAAADQPQPAGPATGDQPAPQPAGPATGQPAAPAPVAHGRRAGATRPPGRRGATRTL